VSYLQFEDGYVYVFAVPDYQPLALHPRPPLVAIITITQLISAFNEAGHNVMAYWVPCSTHKRLLPDGPLPYRLYDKEDLDDDSVMASYEAWKRDQVDSISGAQRVLEIMEETRNKP